MVFKIFFICHFLLHPDRISAKFVDKCHILDMNRFLLFACTLASLLSVEAFSQDMNYRYELPSRKVSSITQDKAGWIWIGTDNGLCRYNGNGFLVFSAVPQEGALENDEINCLFTDGEGTIWFGNQCGIGHSRFGQFVAPETPLYNKVSAFAAVDTAGVIMAERHSILKMSNDFRILSRYIAPHLLNPGLSAIPSKKEVWVYNYDTSDREGVIIVLDSDLEEIRRIKAGKQVTSMIPNPSGNVMWTFGPEGFSSYNLQTYSPQEVPAVLKGLEQDLVFINTFDGHDLLLGMKDGLFRYDSFSGTVKEIDNTLQFDKEGQYVSFVDRDLNVWLYSEGLGLRFIPSATFRSSVQYLPDLLPGQRKTNISADETNGLWILSDKGLDRYSLVSKGITFHADGRFKDLETDPSGNVWVSSLDRTLYKYTVTDGTVTESADLKLREVPRSIAADDKGHVWIAYSNKVQVPREDGSFHTLDLGEGVRILQVKYSSTGRRVFLICSEGIFSLSLDEQGIRRQSILESVKFPTSIEETRDGMIWIGTISEGLLRYNPVTGEIRKWNVFSGLIDNHVKFLQKDNDDFIWVMTTQSIVRLDIKRGTFSYVQKNNLLENRENLLSCCLAADGCLYCSGENGLFRIRPSNIAESTVKTEDIPIYLDYLKVNGKRRTDLKPGVPLKLSFRENMLNLGFSGLKYGYGPYLTYHYQLDGYDSDWIPAYSNSDVSYSNLPAGKYVFRARVKNLNGEWSKKELSVPIDIKPAVWATWWAKLLYFLIAAGIALYGLRLLIQWRLRDERLSLTERDKQLQQDHIDFLVNVSHELRTPLTLISAPLKQLRSSPDLSEADKALVETIDKSAGKLEQLAEQIMNVGKSSLQSESPLKVRKGSLPSTIKAIGDNFRFIALDKELQLEVSLDDSLTDGYFDPEKVERILNNLVSNAVKYTPAGGSPIRIKAGVNPDLQGRMLASISVEDGGPGIPEEKRAELFKRFDRLDADHFSPDIKGAGVGLNYAQHLAVLHHGAITFSDNHPQGSIFTFTFPYLQDAYSEEEIDLRPVPEKANTPEKEVSTAPEQDHGSILLVEDNDDVRAYLKQLLCSRYKVTTAVDGLDGWDCLQAGAVPDLVISDVIMPRKDGFELCRDIKKSADYSLVPVLLLTAKSDLDNHVRGLDSGADAYVAKPFDPFLLMHQAENLIQGRRAMQRKIASMTSATIGTVEEPAQSTDTEEQPVGSHLSEYDRKFLERLYKCMDEHLDEQDFNVSQLSGELFMSYSRVYVKIKMLTGETPLALLNTYRMNVAMERLKTGKYTVGEVSEMVGASSLANFSRSFKRQFGIPPSQVISNQ